MRGLFVLIAASACLLSAASPEPRDLSVLQRLPIRFEASGPEGLWQARGFDYRMAVSPVGCLIGFHAPDGATDSVRFTIEGADPNAVSVPSKELGGTTSYMLGSRSNWRTSVQGYGKVSYQRVLPDVDVVYYGSNGKLEHDFIVAPGGDPGSIRVRYSGQKQLRVDASGNLVIETASSKLVQKAPAIYQKDDAGRMRIVSGEYELLGGGVVGFHVGAYDRDLPLVIDPVLVYSSYIGGSQSETANAVTRDSSGRLYIAGTTSSSDFLTVDGSLQLAKSGGSDVFLQVIDPSGPRVVFSTFLGGSGADVLSGMATAGGKVFLTGTTESSDFPRSQYPAQGTLSGTKDAFFAVLDASKTGDSSLVYSTYFGGSGVEEAKAIAANPDGTAVIVGYTDSTDLPLKGSSVQSTNAGGRDAFVALYDAFQTFTYATYYGGGRTEVARAVAFANDGSILIAGTTLSGDIPVTGSPRQVDAAGGGDAFMAKINWNASSGLVYSGYLGGSGLDEATGILAGSGNMVFVTGYTTSTDFPAIGTAVSQRAGATDAFLAAFDLSRPATQQLFYSVLIGGSEAEVAYGSFVDFADRVVITGYTNSVDFPVTADGLQRTYGGGATDAFVVRLNPTGTTGMSYGSYLGGASTDVGYGVLTDVNGRYYVAGSTTSRTFPASNAAETPNGAGTGDGFIVVVAP